jgi:hypothetical protein
VKFPIGEAEIGVIVRRSDKPPIRAEEVEDMARQVVEKAGARGATVTLVSRNSTKLDGHPAAHFVCRVAWRGEKTTMRGVKCVAMGHDHAITLTAPEGGFPDASNLLDKFLESYHIISPVQ